MSNGDHTGGRPLSPGDYVFMAFLGIGPMSAYDIKKAMAGSVNFFWSAAHSQVYQQARRLVRDGYLDEGETEGTRRRRTLSLTPSGREALGAWLRQPAPLVRVYDEAIAKVFFGDQAGPAALVELLEDQQRRHSELLVAYECIGQALSGWDPGDSPPYQLMLNRLGVDVERVWLGWVDEMLPLLREAARRTAGG